ncbi:MAG: NAD(P)/FAD-dependent oxidoreductase [Vicinamibacterales bacterium]
MTDTTEVRGHYDAVIAGGRCAGAATALLLARAGLRVLVVDRGRRGTDTLSTHALMRGAVAQLAHWGVLSGIIAEGTPAIRRTRFVYGPTTVEVAIKPRGAVDALYAPRRTVLDRHLVDHATAAGARFLFAARIVELERSVGGRVRGAVVVDEGGQRHTVSAGLVIGADGLRSTIAGLTGAATLRTARHSSATVYAHWRDTGLDGYNWFYGLGASAGAIETNGGAVVFASVPTAAFASTFVDDIGAGYHRVLRAVAPQVADALSGATRLGPLRGFPGHPGFLRQAWGAGWALVGDAGYFKDPLTAHGITDALRDAELLARAVTAGSDQALAAYQHQRDALSVRLFEVTDRIASFDWDLESVQPLHRQFSEAMSAEVAALESWHAQAQLPGAALAMP